MSGSDVSGCYLAVIKSGVSWLTHITRKQASLKTKGKLENCSQLLTFACLNNE